MTEPEIMPEIRYGDKTCTNCNKNYNLKDRKPRLLNCLHTFCSECLTQKLQALSQGQITCPKCRQVQKLTGPVTTLPVDPVKARLLEYDQVKQQQKTSCTECEDNQAAESRCQECKVYMCNDCTVVHKKHRLTKDHAIITLQQMLNQPLTSYGTGHFCNIHTAFPMDCYCTTCDTPCCASCTMQEHKNHPTLKTTEAAAGKQNDVDSSMKDLQKQVHTLRTAKTEGEKQEFTLQKIRKESESEINDTFDRLEKVLKDRKVAVLKEYNDRISKLLQVARETVVGYEQTLDKMDTVTSFYTQVKDTADDIERLEMFPVIKSRLQVLNSEAQKLKTDVDKTTVGFQPVNEEKVNNLINALGKVADTGSEAAAVAKGTGARGLIDLADLRKASATAEVSPRPRSALQLKPGQTLTIGQITVHFTTADITKSSCDVIVSSATNNLANDCGVALPIARAAGASLDRECRDSIREIGRISVTEVVTTTAGNLPCKHVLHAARPTWGDTRDKTGFLKDLYKTILRCLCEACNLKAKNVAFPAIGTGMAGVPQDDCAKTYLKAVRVFFDSVQGVSLKEVHFVDIDDNKTKMIRETFVRLQNITIDANGEEARLLAQFLKQGISTSLKKNLRRSAEKLKS